MYLRVGSGLGAANPRRPVRVAVPRLVLQRRGLRGLGLTCPSGYYVSGSSLDPASQTCAPTIETLNLANPMSGENLAFSTAAPGSPEAVFFQNYGGLTNQQQNAVIDCQEYTGANAITGQPIPPQCAGIIAARSPGVPGSVIAPLLYTPPAAPAAAPSPGSAPVTKGGSDLYAPGVVPQGGSPSGAPPVTAVGIKPATATLTNTTRPGQSFQVGDSFKLVITGSPNMDVFGTVTQNGGAPSSTHYGTTDDSGQLTLTGAMDPSTVGAWSEKWMVGSAVAPMINFSVAAAGSATGGNTSSTTAPGVTDFLSGTWSIFGFNVPIWAALLAGGGGVYMLTSGGGRGRG